MLSKDEILQKIEHNKNTIRSFGVKKLTLFGSYAKDNATPGSDVDFLVEFEQGRGLYDDYVHLLHFLEDIFDKRIDLGKHSLLREELRDEILRGAKIEAKI